MKNSFKIDNFSNVLSMDIRDDVRDFKDDKYDLYDIQNKFLDFKINKIIDGVIRNSIIFYMEKIYIIIFEIIFG